MENYTRIPDSIRKDKSLTSTEKLILGYLYTYQNKIVGKKIISTQTYYYDTQAALAEELGTYLREIERCIASLKTKGLIFQKKKNEVDGKNQFKNRKAIIMVDENNPLPIKETIPTSEVSKSVSNEPLTTEIMLTSDAEINELKVFLTDKPMCSVMGITFSEPTKKITNKLILIDILDEHTNEDGLKQGQNVDIRSRIDNDEFYYIEDLVKIINEEIDYNNMCKSMNF